MTHAPHECAVRVDGISKQFGAVRALDNVSLEIPVATVTGLIGANGAGKTTLFDVLCGITRPARGSVRVRVGAAEREATRLAPHRLARLGIQRTFQQLRLASELTVAQNLALGCDDPSFRRQVAGSLRRRRAPDRVAEVAALLQIDGIASKRVSELAYGERKLVSLGRALTGNPKVLLLDEPASGLDEASRTVMVGHIHRVATERDITVCVIEHSLAVVQALTEHLIFMEHGAVVTSGPTREVLGDARVATAYFGVRDGGAG